MQLDYQTITLPDGAIIDAVDGSLITPATPTGVIDLRSLDMGEAYDFTQYGNVSNGDVLLTVDGVAILYLAWPTMIDGHSEVFHRLADSSTWSDVIAELETEGRKDEAAELARGLDLARLPAAELESKAVDFTHLDR
jgi:hypothetical protein